MPFNMKTALPVVFGVAAVGGLAFYHWSDTSSVHLNEIIFRYHKGHSHYEYDAVRHGLFKCSHIIELRTEWNDNIVETLIRNGQIVNSEGTGIRENIWNERLKDNYHRMDRQYNDNPAVYLWRYKARTPMRCQ